MRLSMQDIDGGPGRYATWLAGQGHEVVLLDLARGNVEFARRKAIELGVRLASCIVGNAPALDSLVGPGRFDYVLLRGPLCHLLHEEDRWVAVEKALGVLQPGDNPGLADACFRDPRRIGDFMVGFGLERLGVFTQESILGPCENQIKSADRETFESCIEPAMTFIEDDFCRACGEHVLFVGRKRLRPTAPRSMARKTAHAEPRRKR